MQDDEIQAAVDFADWKIALENETEELKADREFSEQEIERLATEIAKETAGLDKCNAELSTSTQNYNSAVQTYTSEHAAYTKRKDSKQASIDLFTGIIEKYE